ncbi:MAG: exodeoxyribonuclease VII large subunit [Acidobacteriota bacterium]|nr:exodeoxyribonuclease VII large subunit [Acidobacteriota bacterium]
MQQYSLLLVPEHRVFTVSELNSSIRETLDQEFQDVRVAGEISGLRMAQSGHCYFTLKERDSQIRCACFRSTYRYLKFKPQDGIAVVARGRIDVFEARGEYQLMVETLEPQGHGALQLALEELKRKLRLEGLFETDRKRPLPRFPQRIGMVTSPRGAVISDMLQVLERRFPGLHIRLFPAQVQGEGSVEDLCRGLEYFSANPWADVVILARGGGSLEDLWSFNSEAVARAVVASAVPVVSAVGHETDITIADFVADVRAPTPSAAAEMLCCTRQDILDRIAGCEAKMLQAARYRFSQAGRQLGKQGVERARSTLVRQIGHNLQHTDEKDTRLREAVRQRLASAARQRAQLESRLRYHDLRPRLARDHNRLEAATRRAAHAMPLLLARQRQHLETAAAKLEQLSPLRILDRGYALVTNEHGLVKSSADAQAGSVIRVRLAAGKLDAQVTRSDEDTV